MTQVKICLLCETPKRGGKMLKKGNRGRADLVWWISDGFQQIPHSYSLLTDYSGRNGHANRAWFLWELSSQMNVALLWGEKKGSTDCIIFDSMGIASNFPFFSSPSSFFIRLKFCRGCKKWSEPAGLIKQKLKRFIQLWEYFNEFVSLKVLFSENSCSCGILHCLDFVQWEIV